MSLKIVESNRMIIIACAAVVLFFSLIDVNAQTTRRKRSTVPVPRVTPTLPQGEPLIISRAEDFPDTESQTILPTQEQKPEITVETTDGNAKTIEDLGNRIKSLEEGKKIDYDAKQKRLLMNLDILTRAEQRAETLRKQLFEMIEKESTIKTRLDLIDSDVRPESIERSVAFAGTLRPEELRNMRRKNLESEKASLQNLLTEIQKTRANLDQNVLKADILVEKFRLKLEKEIDDALADEPENR